MALNKPYGLEMFGAKLHHSVEKYLPSLAESLDCETLHQVHRLDKITSGILLLAKTKVKHEYLTNLFRKRQIQKTYWTIVNGTPQPSGGIINMPLCESKFGDKFRMTVVPVYEKKKSLQGPRKKIRMTSDIFPVVTEYKTLKEKENTALLEVTPVTGFKHQIRAHLGE